MWLIFIIVAGIVVYFLMERNKKHGMPGETARESPTEILKKRYANGEITKEEFERIKKDIEG